MTGVVETIISLLGGTAGGFVSGVGLQRSAARRARRAEIFSSHIPACRKAIAEYVERVRNEGPIATMEVISITGVLRELYQAAVISSAADEARTYEMVVAADHLEIARERCHNGDLPRRIREGGWARLACETISQVERMLNFYETWLGQRLLARRPIRRRWGYRPIEIDRDLTGEDVSRFAPPSCLSTEALEVLIGRTVESWAVIEEDPIYGQLLLTWTRSDDGSVSARMSETDDGWLRPILNVKDPRFGNLVLTGAELQPFVKVPADRCVRHSSFDLTQHELPETARRELASRIQESEPPE